MRHKHSARIIRLSNASLTLADPAEDITGRSVIDANGDDIGSVDDLMIDDLENKVRFISVTSAESLEMGQTKFLIPVDAISRLTGDTVYLYRLRNQVIAAPKYKPDVVEKEYLERLYDHYGYTPCWIAGYVYPDFPYYA